LTEEEIETRLGRFKTKVNMNIQNSRKTDQEVLSTSAKEDSKIKKKMYFSLKNISYFSFLFLVLKLMVEHENQRKNDFAKLLKAQPRQNKDILIFKADMMKKIEGIQELVQTAIKSNHLS
jgi:hypothetical protein